VSSPPAPMASPLAAPQPLNRIARVGDLNPLSPRAATCFIRMSAVPAKETLQMSGVPPACHHRLCGPRSRCFVKGKGPCTGSHKVEPALRGVR
jgi:hypothetical protein